MPALNYRDARIGRAHARGDLEALRRTLPDARDHGPLATAIAAHLELILRCRLATQTRRDGKGFAYAIAADVMRSRALARRLRIPQAEIDRARRDVARYDRDQIDTIIDTGWRELAAAIEETRPTWQQR